MTELSTDQRTFWQKPYIWMSLVIDLLLLDQGTKYLARYWMENPIKLAGDWFNLRFVENTGVAFSLPVPGGISGVLAVVVSLWLGHQLLTRQLSTTLRFSYALIMAGALGNLVDRMLYGAVTDFIAVGTFPVFNFADSFICVGVVVLLWHEVMSG